jgi:predicted acyl esterase
LSDLVQYIEEYYYNFLTKARTNNMEHTAHFKYLISKNTRLFTVIILPCENGRFPCVVVRTPYVEAFEELSEHECCQKYLKEYREWLEHGYAIVLQHCRGKGKSDGEFIPYINERDDTRALYDWIRKQPFYNGELFLKGTSYLSSVHLCAAPFDDDIKGALFGIQDSERYNICYRNGFFKKGLHGDWYAHIYKLKSKLNKNYTNDSFEILPLSDFTQTAFGEPSADFDEMLASPNPTDAFWQTHNGGADARGATEDIRFPLLLTTGFYDIYTGGIFDMWNKLSNDIKSKSALVVSPYDHHDKYDEVLGLHFPNGTRREQFGTHYDIQWFDHIRGKCDSPIETGKVTYYSIFENLWHTDDFDTAKSTVCLPLGETALTYTYDPLNAPRFQGGLCCNFGGGLFQDKPNLREDIITVYTLPFENDTFVKGKMSAALCVSSDCEDTCFYVRISIEKEQGDYGLRDDITSLCYQLGDYVPNTEVELNFRFDEHSFLIRKGERLRIDIASADAAHYVRHTNQKGLYSKQTTTKIARNTVYLQNSSITLPVI